MNRLLFSKQENAVWISHLDLMRVFQRAFRRAGMMLQHSHGFTPHAYVSILLPLSVGVSSECEILDFALESGPALDEIPMRLNAVLPEGIRILSAYESNRKAGLLTHLKVRLELQYDNGIPPQATEQICALWQRPEVVVHRKTKRGEEDCDLLPMLRQFEIIGQTPHAVLAEAVLCAQNPSLNPQLLVTAIQTYLPGVAPDFTKIHRVELFAKDGSIFR